MTVNQNARLLDCGFCYEEQGEEVHPHPECPIGRLVAPASYQDRADGQTVEAVQWTGSNADALSAFAPSRFATVAPEDRIDPEDDALVLVEESHWVAVRPGWWVLRYADHFDAEPDDRFRAGYEPAAVSVSAAAAPTDGGVLRDRIAALFRQPPGVERLGDATPGEIADAVLAILPPPADGQAAEAHRLALSEALGLGTGAPWDAIRERAAELAAAPPPADRAAVERVRALHTPGKNGECQHCHHSSPCPTVQALDGAKDAELRRLAAEAPEPATQAEAHACGNCEGTDPDTCLMNPDRAKRAPMDPVRILGIADCPTPESHNWGCGCPTDQLPLHAESGVDTPGCDCGHDGMGPKWHAKTCAWLDTLTVQQPAAVPAVGQTDEEA